LERTLKTESGPFFVKLSHHPFNFVAKRLEDRILEYQSCVALFVGAPFIKPSLFNVLAEVFVSKQNFPYFFKGSNVVVVLSKFLHVKVKSCLLEVVESLQVVQCSSCCWDRHQMSI
jgi:hypothetical protein